MTDRGRIITKARSIDGNSFRDKAAGVIQFTNGHRTCLYRAYLFHCILRFDAGRTIHTAVSSTVQYPFLLKLHF